MLIIQKNVQPVKSEATALEVVATSAVVIVDVVLATKAKNENK